MSNEIENTNLGNNKLDIQDGAYQSPQPQPTVFRNSVIGRGGDPLFKNIRATKQELIELLDETTLVQDWVQRETSNNVAITCLDNENLKEGYYKIKDGFGEYGPIVLMGFKNNLGVEIPRLKILDKNGEILEVLTGVLAIEELHKRVNAYNSQSDSNYEAIELSEDIEENIIDKEIEEYKG